MDSFVEGKIIKVGRVGKLHAVWIEEVRRDRGSSAIRISACGVRVIPTVTKKGRKKYLKPFNPQGHLACRRCILAIDLRGS